MFPLMGNRFFHPVIVNLIMLIRQRTNTRTSARGHREAFHWHHTFNQSLTDLYPEVEASRLFFQEKIHVHYLTGIAKPYTEQEPLLPGL